MVRALAERDVPSTVQSVGDGELMPLLRQEDTPVRFAGPRSACSARFRTKSGWMGWQSATSFLLPSHYEGISCAYEADGDEGQPIVSAIGGQPEVVTPGSGILVPQATANSDLRLAVERLVDKPAAEDVMCGGTHAGPADKLESNLQSANGHVSAPPPGARPRIVQHLHCASGLPGLVNSAIESWPPRGRVPAADHAGAGADGQRFLAWARTWPLSAGC